MDNLPIAFDEQQQKIRKRWLFWVIKFTFFLMFIYGLLLAGTSFITELEHPWDPIVGAIIGLIIGGTYLYVLYRSAYVKLGTKFLLFILIVGGISIAYSVYRFYSYPVIDGYELGFRLTGLIYESWIFYLNFLMRRVNLSARSR